MNNNPFVLAFGEIPPLMLDSESRMAVILSDLLADRPNLRNFMVSGVRGSGKTCLLRAIEQKLKKHKEFIFCNLDMGDGQGTNLLNQLAAQLVTIPGMKTLYVKADIKINVSVSQLSLSNSVPFFDVRTEIEKMLKVLQTLNKKVVIMIDEVANTKGLREFTSAYKELPGQNLPVYLIMAGLKENVDSLKNEQSLTFLRRTFPVELEGLNHTSIREKYMEYLNVDLERADELAYMTCRYSFAFQALGFTYLEYGKDWLKYYDALLSSYVYKPLWDSLSEKDKFVLIGINKCMAETSQKIETKDILDAINLKRNELSPYLTRLKKATIIKSTEHGFIEYNYPRFNLFVSTRAENL